MRAFIQQFNICPFFCAKNYGTGWMDGWMDGWVGDRAGLRNFCLSMFLLAHSVTSSPWGSGGRVCHGLGPRCFLRYLICI